jgi:8-oxo-dGTP pyrophosphatase MutT (NUDIX family)
MTAPPIRIAAALILDDQGRALLVRKRGTQAFMQAGGKIEPGEAPLDALKRELREELDIELTAKPDHLGRFSAPAAHEEGRIVEAEIYHLRFSGEVFPAAELEEIRWVDPAAPGAIPLAPLTRDHILPMAQRLVK